MSDQDFNFAPPPAKRERPKPFEPPPWEREQFDELERRRQAGQAEPAEAEPEPDPGPPEPEPSHETETPAATEKDDDEPAPVVGPSEASVAAMLVQLKGEEPPVIEGAWKVSLAASFVIAVIGLAISVIGMVALNKRYGAVGEFGGIVLLLFGIGFIGTGIWVAYRTLRQRGVL